MRKSFICLTLFVVLFFQGHLCFSQSEMPLENDAGLSFVGPEGGTTVYPYTVVVETLPGDARANREVFRLRSQGMPAAVTHDHATNTAFSTAADTEAAVYTVHVGSFRTKQGADTETGRLRKKGRTAFSAAYDLPGKGIWHRVFSGLYQTREAATQAADALSKEFPGALPHRVEGEFFEICVGFQATKEAAVHAAFELKTRGFPFAEVHKKPYAIRIGASDSQTELAQTEDLARQKGFLPYRVPDRRNRYVTRILIGAFEVQPRAEEMRRKLGNLGFQPVIVLR